MSRRGNNPGCQQNLVLVTLSLTICRCGTGATPFVVSASANCLCCPDGPVMSTTCFQGPVSTSSAARQLQPIAPWGDWCKPCSLTSRMSKKFPQILKLQQERSNSYQAILAQDCLGLQNTVLSYRHIATRYTRALSTRHLARHACQGTLGVHVLQRHFEKSWSKATFKVCYANTGSEKTIEGFGCSRCLPLPGTYVALYLPAVADAAMCPAASL